MATEILKALQEIEDRGAGAMLLKPWDPTWWLIPLSKWVTTLVINGISRFNPLIIGVITHLLSGMNHQAMAGNGKSHGM